MAGLSPAATGGWNISSAEQGTWDQVHQSITNGNIVNIHVRFLIIHGYFSKLSQGAFFTSRPGYYFSVSGLDRGF